MIDRQPIHYMYHYQITPHCTTPLSCYLWEYVYITCTAITSLPLCQSIPVCHSNYGSTYTLRVLPLHHYPSVRVSLHTTVTLTVRVHYVYCHCIITPLLCQSIPAYHSNSGSTCTLRVRTLHHYPSVRVSLHTTVTLAVRVHYVYCHCIITPLSEYPCIPQ